MPIEKILYTHNLSEFIPFFESTIETVGWSWDMGEEGLRKKDDFVTLVKEFESIDPGSYSFRYPTKTNGDDSLPDHFSFNLLDFSERIDPLLKVLDSALIGLDAYWDNASEIAYYEQDDLE